MLACFTVSKRNTSKSQLHFRNVNFPFIPVLQLLVHIQDAGGHQELGGRSHELRGHRHELPGRQHHRQSPHQGWCRAGRAAGPRTQEVLSGISISGFDQLSPSNHRSSSVTPPTQWCEAPPGQNPALTSLITVSLTAGPHPLPPSLRPSLCVFC